MTAIQTWADQLSWTTTQTEQTVYEQFYPEMSAAAGSIESLKAEKARLLAEIAKLRAPITPPTPPVVQADAQRRIVSK